MVKCHRGKGVASCPLSPSSAFSGAQPGECEDFSAWPTAQELALLSPYHLQVCTLTPPTPAIRHQGEDGSLRAQAQVSGWRQSHQPHQGEEEMTRVSRAQPGLVLMEEQSAGI